MLPTQLHHHHHNRFTALFPDHPGEPVPEENFWTLWCKGRLTEADTPIIWLGAIPSGLTSAHLVAAWRSGNVVCRINKVTLRQARLVLGWVTVFGGQTTSVFH